MGPDATHADAGAKSFEVMAGHHRDAVDCYEREVEATRSGESRIESEGRILKCFRIDALDVPYSEITSQYGLLSDGSWIVRIHHSGPETAWEVLDVGVGIATAGVSQQTVSVAQCWVATFDAEQGESQGIEATTCDPNLLAATYGRAEWWDGELVG
jgi:hypothetical protein